MFDAIDAITEALFPARCLACGRDGTALCEGCIPLAPERFVCAGIPCFAMGRYDGVLRRAVLAMKRGRRDVAADLGRALARRCPDARGSLVPVPTTRRRRLERGFDQSVLLAEAFASLRGNPVVVALRQTSEEAQHGRSREARLRARGRFVAHAAERLAEGAVLVDDVVTTGATLADCSRALRTAGFVVAGALLVARAADA